MVFTLGRLKENYNRKNKVRKTQPPSETKRKRFFFHVPLNNNFYILNINEKKNGSSLIPSCVKSNLIVRENVRRKKQNI